MSCRSSWRGSGDRENKKEDAARKKREEEEAARQHEADLAEARLLLPRLVKSALDNGYTTVHKGLLLWSPIPSAGDIPKLRLLYIAIEAALSFCFWAMQSKTKDYSMSSCCPWPRGYFSYSGLCSHCALAEYIAREFDLSSEQLEAIAAPDRVRAYQRERNHRHRKA